eukprot:TRINITY_DN15988_c0_g1_i1.p1 TRINITY_DN15988_c0_g1~~TRINITY_DN15988_c0_g1_i1.p1  ORF type:complete len:208 (-),score=83.22 TRINITY_DN15988_c0_g1_i1:103-696(-)
MKSMSNNIETIIPDLQRIAKKVTDTFIGLKNNEEKQVKIKEKVKNAKDNLKKTVSIGEKVLDYLDLSWEFEIADCEIVILDPNWDPNSDRKPFGKINISNFNRQALSSRFENLEKQLIDTKLTLAEKNSHVDKLNDELKDFKDVITQISKKHANQKQKFNEDMDNIQRLLIETKMKLAEAQAENDELKSSLRHGRKS